MCKQRVDGVDCNSSGVADGVDCGCSDEAGGVTVAVQKNQIKKHYYRTNHSLKRALSRKASIENSFCEKIRHLNKINIEQKPSHT